MNVTQNPVVYPVGPSFCPGSSDPAYTRLQLLRHLESEQLLKVSQVFFKCFEGQLIEGHEPLVFHGIFSPKAPDSEPLPRDWPCGPYSSPLVPHSQSVYTRGLDRSQNEVELEPVLCFFFL